MDKISADRRSKLMSRVRTKNTAPELIVRKLLHAMGYRYRLHIKSLPGTPDIVFTKRKKAIFVHGCFWHGHLCKRGSLPKSNVKFWRTKIEKNTTRDERTRQELETLGWQVLVVWQCETKNSEELSLSLREFLGASETLPQERSREANS